MAEMISSAVVHETVSQVLSSIVQKYGEKEQSKARKNIERLEMAHIRLEAALETSEKWHITDASLLRWRRKLKRAAKECDDSFHKCKHRILEEEQMEQEVRNSTFLKRIAHATKSFIVSSFGNSDNQLSHSTVRRFEWLADGASEFIRFVEFGGTPRPHMTVNSLINHLLSGKKLEHKFSRGHEDPLFLLCLVPYTATEHGIEARLLFIHKDGNTPKNNFVLTILLQISESTDIVGIIIKCLQLFTPNFKLIVEIIKKELTQLPIQDLPWVPCVDSYLNKHWDNLHCSITKWFRPNPLCCKQHNQHKLCRSSKLYTSGSLDVSLEPVSHLFLQGQVLPSECNKRCPSLSEHQSSLKDCPYLEVGIAFAPHSSIEDMLPPGTCSALAAVVGERQHLLHTDISLEQLEEIMLPKAVDYFRKNAEATVHQMFWKSEHGTAYIQVEKASICTLRTSMRTSVTVGGARKRKMLQRQDEDVGSQPNVLSQLLTFLNLWVAHAPLQLRGSIVDWIQKETESQLAAQQLHLKF